MSLSLATSLRRASLLGCLFLISLAPFYPAVWVAAAPGYVTRQAITLPAISAGPSRAPLHFVVNMPTPAPQAAYYADEHLYDSGDLKTVTAQHDVTVVVTVTNTHHSRATPTVSTTIITHTAVQPVTTTRAVRPPVTTTTTTTTTASHSPQATSTTAANGCATTIYNNCGNGCNCNGVDNNGYTTTATYTTTLTATPTQSGDGGAKETTRRTKTRVVTNTRTVFSGPTITINENSGPAATNAPTNGATSPVTLVVNLPAPSPSSSSSSSSSAADLAFGCGNRTFSYIAKGTPFQTAVNACTLADLASSAEMVCVSNAVHTQQLQHDGLASFVWVAAWEGAASDHLALMPAPAPASGSLNTIPDGPYGRICEGNVLSQGSAGAHQTTTTTVTAPQAAARITTTITTSAFPTDEITIEGQQPISNLHIVVEEPESSWARKWLW